MCVVGPGFCPEIFVFGGQPDALLAFSILSEYALSLPTEKAFAVDDL